MQCISPRKAGYDTQGNITFSQKLADKSIVGFSLPCGKCLPCRLNQARDKATRAYHEAQMHEDNIFLTLTYNDENIGNGRLNYLDFQLFMKRLRKHVTDPYLTQEAQDTLSIPFMVTGEYGDKTKRPHWHAILFNYKPTDAEYKYTSGSDYEVFTSKKLEELWGKGNIEFGSVTMDSASYVARYAAKKLCHGNDQDHEFHPIHKTSKKHVIGKKWIEKYWKHTFGNGFIVLPNGQKSSIPRYYVDWFKKTYPDEYMNFLLNVKQEVIKQAETKKRQEDIDYISTLLSNPFKQCRPLTRPKVKETILKQKFKQLQERLKI